MSILTIINYPDPRLKTKASKIDKFDDNLKTLANDMFETMYNAHGIGLAATQVDIHKRIIVVDISEEKDQGICLINPVITSKEGLIGIDEGCLSVPNTRAYVDRAQKITVTYQNLEGEKQVIEACDLLSICIQHEIDHLDGIVFVDYLSSFKQRRIKNKLNKLK